MGTLFFCMGELVHAEGCGSYFANRGNETMILLYCQVEAMIFLNCSSHKIDHVHERAIVLFVIVSGRSRMQI